MAVEIIEVGQRVSATTLDNGRVARGRMKSFTGTVVAASGLLTTPAGTEYQTIVVSLEPNHTARRFFTVGVDAVEVIR